ncbi:hypothetical protein GQ44DRAFT_697591 [Phaeosphaeriaceae sp. PMI808]|nr:hypothetical protein GQ44DRAFT_697591 [Phaeosphaeriaceae sp. PMI808]
MAPRVQRMLRDLYRFPLDRYVMPEEDRDQFLEHWGFTIYRTFYGPGSDEKWSKLLQNITAGTEDRLNRMDGAEDTPVTTKVWGLFKLDARSDPTLLDGLTLEDVRKLYLEGAGGRPMNVDRSIWRLFLLADAEVLGDSDLRLLKVAAADYDPVAAVPKNRRAGPQHYFGWITMPSTTALDLWNELDSYTLGEIADSTSGGPGAYWDPDNCW